MIEYTFNNDKIGFDEVSSWKKEIYLNDVKSELYLIWTKDLDLSDEIFLTPDLSQVLYKKTECKSFDISEEMAQEIYNKL
jgi:hypothetical protein